ncbi:abhydrolase domain-containing protein C22H12.03-like isoform X2 [Miscanthus floridulus]|uniref:abhydrolase domain-containing protein C22H12.03-like isoform X2 n=1 Tax=Miscanthus floridulus TaxID=154761 RepID=UPI0034578171
MSAAARAPPPPRALSAPSRRAPLGAVSLSAPRPGARVRAARPREENFHNNCLLTSSSLNSSPLLCPPCNCAQMALADTRIPYQPDVDKHAGVLAYELVQGNLVQWNSFMDKAIPDPPTAVLLHGILGSRKNWGSFAKRLAQEFPMWQFLLVDLRCHGDSASIKKRGPHTIASTALDVLKLVWVLDATPGKVRAGVDGEDHPAELIEFLRRMPEQVSSKQEVVDALVKGQFSVDVARWVATNLHRTSPLGQRSSSSFSWTFDLNGISEMYKSYEDTNLWRIVENVPRGVHINFLKAERSLHRWALEDLQRIHTAEELAADEGGGVEMHVLEDAGHWVHADNPDGLFRILSSTFRIETTIRGMQD